MSKRVRVGIILHLRRLEHLHEGDAHAFGDGRDIFQDRHILISIPKAARERRFRRCPLVTRKRAKRAVMGRTERDPSRGSPISFATLQDDNEVQAMPSIWLKNPTRYFQTR
jgi:hypothetical protein